MKELAKLIRRSNYIYIMGNGGSASTANHLANDLVKMCGVKAISLCANEAIVMAYANDNGYENIFSDQLKVFLNQGDLIITISGSGTSKNIVRAIKYASKKGIDVYSFPTMEDKKCDMQDIENYHLKFAHSVCRKLYRKEENV